MAELYLHSDGQQKGPFTPEQLRQMVASGQANDATLAWRTGLAQWAPLGQLAPEIFGATGSVPAPPGALPPTPPPAPKKGMHAGLIAAIIIGVCVVGLGTCGCLAGIAIGPVKKGIEKAKEAASVQSSRAIGLAMFAYANDHNGAYPDGKTSTEVCQKLVDENYISDPGTFYLAMPGKSKATSNHLTAANVCYDVTSGVTSSSPDDLPLVFTTGYTMTYAPGGQVRPNLSTELLPFPGICIAYKGNSAKWLGPMYNQPMPPAVPDTFKADKTYTQLTP